MEIKTIVVSIVVLCIAANAFAQTTIYVSPKGNDITGKGSATNPYKTIEYAKSVVKNIPGHVDVCLAGGIYNLTGPLIFDTNDGDKTYKKSHSSDTVIISAGMTVPSSLWRPLANGIYSADLSSLGREFHLRQLYLNDRRYMRARLYNDTSFNIRASSDNKSYVFNRTSINLNTLARPAEVEVIAEWHWQWASYKVKSIHGDTITFQTAYDPYKDYVPFFDDNGTRYPFTVSYLENAYEFLDRPGEYYYDKMSNQLYLIPDTGSGPPSSWNVVIPMLDTIISGSNVHHLTFDGLMFSYTTWSYMINNEYHPYQASCYITSSTGNDFIPGSIDFSGSTHITFQNCTFTHLGTSGLCFENNSSHCTIYNNQFNDISADAIRIGHPALYVDNDHTNTVTISKNTIHDAACEYKCSVGIFIGLANTVTINNNDIYNLPYTGISTGWRWTVLPTNLDSVNILDNSIHNVVNELDDGAGIYNLGRHKTGSSITNNYIYSIPPGDSTHARAGIYLDQGSDNVTVKDNHGDRFPLFRGVKKTDIFLNYNSNDESRGNIIGTNNFGGDSVLIKK